MTCQKYTRSFLHNLAARGLPFASTLVTYHNVAYTQALTRRMRTALEGGSFPDFVRGFVRGHFAQVGCLGSYITIYGGCMQRRARKLGLRLAPVADLQHFGAGR